jgi:hypothetical protein
MPKRQNLRPEEWTAVGGTVLSVLAVAIEVFGAESPFKGLKPWFAVFGVCSLLGSLIVSIGRFRKAVDDLQGLPSTVESALKFGGAIGLIAEAVRLGDSEIAARSPHLTAGGRTLGRYALEILPDRARELREPGPGRLMTLVEYHYINDFLHNLIACLPAGSSWFGVTHLTQGWLERFAEPGYRDVVALMQERSRRGEIEVLRIYCVKDPSELGTLQDHLTNEAAARISVRVITGEPKPPDLSLVWGPAKSEVRRIVHSSNEPEQVLREQGAALSCGIEFSTAAGRVIKQLEVYSPTSEHVKALRNAFSDAWRGATPPSS